MLLLYLSPKIKIKIQAPPQRANSLWEFAETLFRVFQRSAFALRSAAAGLTVSTKIN